MTREEEIKTRLEQDTAVYLDSDGDKDPQADDDMEYLLARNDELQRRVKDLEVDLATYKHDEAYHHG